MAFAIDDLTAVIAHWNAGDITGLSLDDPVSSLPDSISGWHLTGATTTRPLYKPTGINSLPAVQFDGSDDYLVTGSTKSITSPFVGSCAVLYLPTRKDYSAFGTLSASSGVPAYYPTPVLQSMGYAGGSVLLSNGSTYVQSNNGPASAANALLVNLIGKSVFGNITNGIWQLGGGASGNSIDFVSGSYYAGFGRANLAGSAFAGMLAEWVLFEQTILNEHCYIEGVLAHKYGITMPTSHPFYAAAPTSPPSSGGTAGFTGLSGVGRLGT